MKHKYTNHSNYYQEVLLDAALQPFERQAVDDPQCYGNYYIDGSAEDGGETGSRMSLGDADDKSKFHSKWDFNAIWQINSGGLPTLRDCSFQNIAFTPESE